MPGWENNIRQIEPYVPGEQPQGRDVIKLNTNENPYPPSPRVEKCLHEIDMDSSRKYPDPTVSVLKNTLGEYYGISADRFFVGAGSDDVLSTAFLTFFNSDKPIIFPDVTYSFYPVWAKIYRIPYREIPLDDDFRIRVSDYKGADCGGIVIANPNAPTSIELGIDAVEEIISSNPDVIVIVDEAYIDFGGESALTLLDKYDNLVVVRTFSKSRAMAGARIGFAISSTRLISAMNDVEQSINSYPLAGTSMAAAVESVKDDEYFRARIRDVLSTRERTTKKLAELGFEVLPSGTNFVFAKSSDMSGEEIFEMLKKKEIYVRHFGKERIKDYLRITIGTDEEMDKLFEALKAMK